MSNTPLHHSAEKILTRNIPTAISSETAEHIISKIKHKVPTFDSINYVYILSSSGKLIGVVAIKSLLRAQSNQPVQEIMTKDLFFVHPHTDKEKVAMLSIKQNIKSVPVVDKNDYFLGAVVTDQILNILHDEHIEDILMLSGLDVSIIQTSEKKRKTAISSFRMRFPWLFLGLLGGLFSTYLVSSHESLLQSHVRLAFFMPIIVYMGGAIANQTLSMLIRNIIVTNLNVKKFYFNELLTSIVLGLLFGSLLSLISYFWFHSPEISIIIFLTMPINAMVTTTISTFIPLVFVKTKKDPALAAGPFAIIIQDFLSLLTYFTISTILLSIL